LLFILSDILFFTVRLLYANVYMNIYVMLLLRQWRLNTLITN